MEFGKFREEKAVDTVIELLKEGNYKKAKIKLGEIKGRPKEFMEMFSYLTKGSGLEGTKLKIKPVKAKVKCLSCDWRGDPDISHDGVSCPRCKGDVEILKGNELHVTV